MTDRHPAFFGYGSLVNRATHDHAPATPARLAGWRRVWRHTAIRRFAFLSAEPAGATDAGIDGLVAAVPGDDWAALDLREAAYRRQPLAPDRLDPAPPWADRIEIYAVAEAHPAAPAPQPILLSYLDTVVLGFAREFGTAGVARFFASTTGWGPLLDDRADPLYPRHQRLTAAERALTDAHAQTLGLARLRP